jgi:ribosomal protein S18 acetylase RimI-like enzyme
VNQTQNKEKFDDFETRKPGFDKNVPGNTGLRLRLLTPGDAAALRGLRHRAIGECAWNFGTPPGIEHARGLGYYRRQLFQARFHSSTRYLGLWDGVNLVGMAGLRLRRTRGTPFGLIFSMYLLPEYRGRHIGRALLRAAQDRIRADWDPPRLRMQVEVHNRPALRLYQSEGFHILDTETAAFRIGTTDYDVHVLEKPLQ